MSPDLGGSEGLRSLSACARDAGLGLILDVVPNHMAADDANRYWADPALREKFFDVEPSTGVYRRFFDIDDLAGVRQEDPEVFEETHELVISLVRDGVIDGLRIDHPDGLADPAAIWRGCGIAGSTGSGSRRSSTPASGCATGRCAARSATSSSTTCARCSSIRPARRR